MGGAEIVNPAPIKFLCLGDSYTIGTGVSYNDNWPSQLTGLLHRNHLVTEKPLILAKNGWTSGDLLDAIHTHPIQGPFDFVTLLIGVNDQYDGIPLASYIENFQKILHRAVSLARGIPGRVIVLSIPDWSVTPFAADRDRHKIRSEIQNFNRENADITSQQGCPYVDITPSSRLAEQNLKLLAQDELHPSGKMYRQWARLLLPIVISLVG